MSLSDEAVAGLILQVQQLPGQIANADGTRQQLLMQSLSSSMLALCEHYADTATFIKERQTMIERDITAAHADAVAARAEAAALRTLQAVERAQHERYRLILWGVIGALTLTLLGSLYA